MENNLTIEFQLLVRCCTGCLQNEPSSVSTFLDHHPPDWNRFLSLVQKHKLVPLVYQVLTAFPERVPREILSALSDLSGRSLNRIENLGIELLKIQLIFESAGLPFLAIKGPLMIRQLYGDAACRQTRDLDLLIMPESLDIAINRLQDSGYILQDGYFLRNPEKRDLYMKRENHVRFRHPNKRIIIELHWAVSRYFTTLSTGYWFEHASEIAFEGKVFRTLPPENYFLLLATHGVYHKYELLFWLYDIAHLLTNSDVNRKSIIERAKTLQCESAVRVSIALADRIFGAEVPKTESQHALSLRDKFLFDQCIKSLSHYPQNSERLHAHSLIASLKHRFSDRLYFLLMTNSGRSRCNVLLNTFIKPYVWKEGEAIPRNNLTYLFITQIKWLKMLFTREISRGGRIRKGRRT